MLRIQIFLDWSLNNEGHHQMSFYDKSSHLNWKIIGWWVYAL